MGGIILDKCRVRLRHFWRTLWIREDEFHRSLDLDVDYLGLLSEKERVHYFHDLERRREVAHNRSKL